MKCAWSVERKGGGGFGGFISAAGTASSWMDGDSVVKLFLFSSGCFPAGVQQRRIFSGVLGVRERARASKEVYGSSLVYFIFRHVFRYPSFWRVLVDGWEEEWGSLREEEETGHDGSCWRLRWGVGAGENMLDSALCKRKQGGC